MKKPTSTPAFVTEWVAKVKTGDQDAARQLWDHYFERLVNLARAKLPAAGRRAADEEDVVISALDSFFRQAKQGKYEELHDRHDLWRLLARITCFKSCDLIRRIPKEKGESSLGQDTNLDQSPHGLDAWKDDKHAFPFDSSTMTRLSQSEGVSEFIGRLDLESRELLDKLDDKKLRLVALRRLQGYTLKEIAKELGCVISTVELKLRRIQKLWSKEMAS